MNSPRQIVILCGMEIFTKDDGSIRYSDTFLNNARSFIKDNPRDTVNVIDARDYLTEDHPVQAMMNKLQEHSKTAPVDLCIYSGHSTFRNLLVFYKTRPELPMSDRVINEFTSWDRINFAPLAEIWLWGCRTGGDYVKDPNSVAQKIANKSLVPTFGYICRTSQKKIDGKFYQLPEKSSYHFEKFEPQR